ncbi:acyl-CoA reductase-like NAD-dependent aldehyde dehydrogenase [Rhizobium leguminosarum]|nr:aldehyde dehydrogenase family protein [Rhizobium leguminosarum]MBP2445797.1 acyl-CoA reductase-like NAD-dependent aldehyde dehydrogenase [Rhizobium leguminosarum]
MAAYPDTQLYINGRWRDGSDESLTIVNPASGEVIGRVSNAGKGDLDEALSAAAAGFEHWRQVTAFERAKLMHDAAKILRDRSLRISVNRDSHFSKSRTGISLSRGQRVRSNSACLVAVRGD